MPPEDVVGLVHEPACEPQRLLVRVLDEEPEEIADREGVGPQVPHGRILGRNEPRAAGEVEHDPSDIDRARHQARSSDVLQRIANFRAAQSSILRLQVRQGERRVHLLLRLPGDPLLYRERARTR